MAKLMQMVHETAQRCEDDACRWSTGDWLAVLADDRAAWVDAHRVAVERSVWIRSRALRVADAVDRIGRRLRNADGAHDIEIWKRLFGGQG